MEGQLRIYGRAQILQSKNRLKIQVKYMDQGVLCNLRSQIDMGTALNQGNLTGEELAKSNLSTHKFRESIEHKEEVTLLCDQSLPSFDLHQFPSQTYVEMVPPQIRATMMSATNSAKSSFIDSAPLLQKPAIKLGKQQQLAQMPRITPISTEKQIRAVGSQSRIL
ncbi:hypothetical protein FGO68_gene6486 [Halteria grandinella]|uniref:Uncharacterized protein n=1 Tax=Halteria grandinella TaxID=5974 RepID=A0A8J8T299_HALGN|nr:hypothetical protein FGO68_gene6486 [Halteria grandinella]